MAFVFRSRTPRDGEDDDDVNDEAPTPACALPTTPRSAPNPLPPPPPPPRALYFLSRAKETNREDTAACMVQSLRLVAENEAKNDSMKKSLFLFSRVVVLIDG